MPLAARRTQEPESLRLKRALLRRPACICSRLSGSTALRPRTPPIIPLLDLARELQSDARARPARDAGRARVAPGRTRARAGACTSRCRMRAQPGRVAFRRICTWTWAAAHVGHGRFRRRGRAYRRAHACRPRDAQILAALAGVLFDARDYAGAREAINASLAIDPRSVNANRLAGNIDFVDERWADAIARFRYVAASDPDRVQAGYGQLMFWLAQMRAGVREARIRRSARPAKAGRSRCCCTCAANTPKRSSSRRSRKATTATTRSPTPAPTSGCARRCSTSARRTGRADNPRWRATTSRRW